MLLLLNLASHQIEGSEFNQPGKAANKVKGKAIPNEKPNIPIIGPK